MVDLSLIPLVKTCKQQNRMNAMSNLHNDVNKSVEKIPYVRPVGILTPIPQLVTVGTLPALTGI